MGGVLVTRVRTAWRWQVALRIANEKYIRDHPELPKMMAACIEHVVTTRPGDMLQAAKDFFTSDAAARAAQS